MEFGADPRRCEAVVAGVRRETRRPVFVKLSPALANIGEAALIAADAGADAISVVNTIPGLVIDVEHRRPALGFGAGGVSGPAILPVGVLATWKVRQRGEASDSRPGRRAKRERCASVHSRGRVARRRRHRGDARPARA